MMVVFFLYSIKKPYLCTLKIGCLTNRYSMMKKIFVAWALMAAVTLQARTWTVNDVKGVIRKVNTYWQSNNPAEVRSFWDNAAYHTGNIEVYKLLGDQQMLDYSVRWAAHNQWKGATETDPAKWKYKQYGEGQDYVLFGDWQICFQTYIDLYRLTNSSLNFMVERAKEVMGYEAASKAHDYWWWADALYMVMPVMTKMYQLTGERKYLDKLYENLLYTDSLMLDKETGLYFRDARYVYPKHKTEAGQKDFWARGDGWVLAGLAKVLQDLPETYARRSFFVEKFTRLAAAVASLQQPEGYWTRSMMDPQQAPGPETSGTAFFCYGLLWGINKGYLPQKDYAPVIEKAWKYLTTTALQKDGRIGYVQPIGDRAVPGQVVNAGSQANFGVGAFLLAACEYARYIDKVETAGQTDRAYWCSLAYQMAQPVLENMAKGKLRKNMLTEFSPSFDKRDRSVVYMETFGRLMAGIAPWLTLPDDNTPEGRQRRQLREWALASYKNAVDPQSPDYLCWGRAGQNLVDAAYIAESFLRAWDTLWEPLDSLTKQRYIKEFQHLRGIDPPYTNWFLFSSTIESMLAKAGAQYDMFRVNTACRKVEEWYVGDGWYADGPVFAFDYYSSYVFHAMYLETLKTMMDARAGSRLDYKKYYERALQRAQKFSIILERFISPDGTFPVIGRSTPYRMAAMQPLALMAWYQTLPQELGNGQVRAALTAVLHRMFDQQNNFNKAGFLTIGFCGHQPETADWYTNNGSLYMTTLAFMPLGLPADHPFWTADAAPWTQVKAWNGQPFPKDHRWADTIQTKDKY